MGQHPAVTPFVGVWIETLMAQHIYLQTDVTPFVGVWIETRVMAGAAGVCSVTPFVGVWIETKRLARWSKRNCSHTLRGCVD